MILLAGVVHGRANLHLPKRAAGSRRKRKINAFRTHVGRRGIGIDVIVERDKQLGIVIVLGLAADKGLGHPGLYGHAARAVGDVGQVAGVNVGADVGTAGRSRSPSRRTVSDGRNFVNLHLILEITQHGIVLAAAHQVNLVIAFYAACVPLLVGKGRIVRVVVPAIYYNVRRIEVIPWDRALIQVHGMGGIVVGGIGIELFDTTSKVFEIFRSRDGAVKGRSHRQVAGVVVFLSAQVLEGEVLVIGDKALDAAVRDQCAL